MTSSHARKSVVLSFLAVAFGLCSAAVAADPVTVDFENLQLASNSYWSGPEPGVTSVPSDYDSWHYETYTGKFTSGGAVFNNVYTETTNILDPTLHFTSWAGWAYSNKTDATARGYDNQYSAAAGSGQNGTNNYAVAYGGYPAATITVPQNTLFQSAYLTNTTYAYLSMRDGDSFAKKFGGPNGTDPDWFKLTITGRNAAQAVLGSIDVYLADFRPADQRSDNPYNKQNYILDKWMPVDLAGLGNSVQSLSLSFASSDNDQIWGMNTPAYAAFDTLTAVPASQSPLPPDVQNAAALTVAGGLHELGRISGNGTLVVQPDTTLVADSIVQDTLSIGAGATVVIRETGAQQAAAVPEPGLLALLLGGGVVLAVRLCRRPRRAKIA